MTPSLKVSMNLIHLAGKKQQVIIFSEVDISCLIKLFLRDQLAVGTDSFFCICTVTSCCLFWLQCRWKHIIYTLKINIMVFRLRNEVPQVCSYTTLGLGLWGTWSCSLFPADPVKPTTPALFPPLWEIASSLAACLSFLLFPLCFCLETPSVTNGRHLMSMLEFWWHD